MRKRTRQKQIQRIEKAAATGAVPRVAEQILLDVLAELKFERMLCTSIGRAQFAAAAASANPQAQVSCLYLDLFETLATQEQLAESEPLSNLQLVTATDFPAETADLVVIPTAYNDEADLTRDLLQSGFERLSMGGQLWTATNNPRDQWLGEQLERFFDKVTRTESSHGALYHGQKTAPLKKHKNYDCEFAFRDGERLFNVISRPGVFSHRRMDPGCRHLINSMVIEPGQRVVDLGCGIGAVSLAAAARQPTAQLLAVDCYTRAIQCVEQNAARNDLTNIRTELNALLEFEQTECHDLVVMNPPYYGKGEIALRFLQGAFDLLVPGGQLLVVMKTPNWYAENMSRWFEELEIIESKKYWIATGRKG